MSELFCPSVTFCLLTYNCLETVLDAVEGAVKQTYPNLKIKISDDASTDGTFEFLSEYISINCLHDRVELIGRSSNLGIIKHVERVMFECETDFIVLAAGDDISIAERVSELMKVANAGTMLVHSSCRSIEDGQIISPKYRRSHSKTKIPLSTNLVIGATCAWSTQLIKNFGVVKYDNLWEDQVYTFRALLSGEIAYVGDPLVLYRTTGGISNKRELPVSYTGYRDDKLTESARKINTARQKLIDIDKVTKKSFFSIKTLILVNFLMQLLRHAVYKNEYTSKILWAKKKWLK